jgi:hypothetical protein
LKNQFHRSGLEYSSGIKYPEPIYVEVKFTEASTGQVIEAFAHLTLVEYGYETVLTGSEFLVPNQIYDFKVSLRRIGTGVPVSQTDKIFL